MGVKGCCHLQGFKKNQKNLETLKWIHVVFVIGNHSKSRKLKICNSYCRTCRRRGPFLHACLECVYFGCHRHIRDHMKSSKHIISLDLIYGQIHCSLCNDYVYDAEIDDISIQNKMYARKFKKRLFSWALWDPTEEERELLLHRTKRICINPDSMIGLRGLVNLGSTCFMNCVVQALVHTPLLRDYFLSERHECSLESGTCQVCVVSKLFQEFYKGSSVPLAMNDLLHLTWTHAPSLAGIKQQDAHEFLIATLNLLHQHFSESMPNSLNATKEKEKSAECPCIVDKIFTGYLQSDLVCQKCNGVSTTNDPIRDFSLDLAPVTMGSRSPLTLTDCLEWFTRVEHLDANSIVCSNCNSHDGSTIQFTIGTLPIVASFHLKRFEHIGENRKKINTAISFPEMLDLTPYMSRSKKHSPFPNDNRYSLFAVINHIGNNLNTGHYKSYVRQQQDYWYKCDDQYITKANLKEVLNSEGYLLFYHKQVLDYE